MTNEFDYRGKKISCPLSAGINSMAVLCWLSKYEFRPKEVYIFYAHFKEHSPQSLEFVMAGVEYAKTHFEKVIFEYTENSIIDFFEQEKMIPHPTFAPCTQQLKIKPSNDFLNKYECSVDLVGYIRNEGRRIKNMKKKGTDNLFLSKHFPIFEMTDEDCFNLVEKEIGWFPDIYKIKWDDPAFVEFVTAQLFRFDVDTQKRILNKLGKNVPVFKHNNCLPCKNMQIEDMLAVEFFFPEYYKAAIQLSEKLQAFWGRDKDSFVDAFMTSFGREDWEVEHGCKICEF